MAEAAPPLGTEQQHATSPPQATEAHANGQQPPMQPEHPAQPEAHEPQPGEQPHPGELEQSGEQALPGQPATPPGGEQPQHPREDLVPDGKHSWTVAVGAAWNVFCCSLLRRAMPVMFLAVGDAFATTSKGPVAWMNAFIYSLAYLLSPVATLLCRNVPLKLLSAAGALLIGVGPIVCFFLSDLSIMVPVIGLCCGVGAALSIVVDETAVCLHFKAQRHKALSFIHAAFALPAIVYPVMFMLLVDMFGLDGAMLVSGAVSFNALAGSLVMSR
nr:monocarboxylate transporter 9-like [Rhipicephalus microplus]